MSTVTAESNVTSLHDYKVADIGLADFGRREITLAEAEMPALMALRDKYPSSFRPIPQNLPD